MLRRSRAVWCLAWALVASPINLFSSWLKSQTLSTGLILFSLLFLFQIDMLWMLLLFWFHGLLWQDASGWDALVDENQTNHENSCSGNNSIISYDTNRPTPLSSLFFDQSYIINQPSSNVLTWSCFNSTIQPSVRMQRTSGLPTILQIWCPSTTIKDRSDFPVNLRTATKNLRKYFMEYLLWGPYLLDLTSGEYSL